jgi:hypothetical protein
MWLALAGFELAAQAQVGTVSGTIALADPAQRGEPPARGRGFLARAANPLKPPRAFDPLPQVVVVLEGGAGTAEPPKEPVRYSIVGQSFSSPILPVMVGAAVELRNDGKASPRLYAPSAPDLLTGDPINPKGARLIKKIAKANQAIELRDHDSAHLSGRIVAFEQPYFSRVDADGKFQITGVPAGPWKVRVWYRDGWVDGVEQSVTVVAKKDAAVKLSLPAKLATGTGK